MDDFTWVPRIPSQFLADVVISRVFIFTLCIHTGCGIYGVSTQKAGTGGRVDEKKNWNYSRTFGKKKECGSKNWRIYTVKQNAKPQTKYLNDHGFLPKDYTDARKQETYVESWLGRFLMPRYKEHEIFLKCHSDMDAKNIPLNQIHNYCSWWVTWRCVKQEPTVIGMLHFSSCRKHASK